MSCKGDLCRSATGQQEGFLKKLARHAEGIAKAPFHLTNRFVGGAFGHKRSTAFLRFNNPVHDAVPAFVCALDEHAKVRLPQTFDVVAQRGVRTASQQIQVGPCHAPVSLYTRFTER